MSIPPRSTQRSVWTGLVLLVLCLALLPACSDDPILGPTDGSSDDGGGSYSSINRLSPNAVDSSSSTPAAPSGRDPVNPERF